ETVRRVGNNVSLRDQVFSPAVAQGQWIALRRNAQGYTPTRHDGLADGVPDNPWLDQNQDSSVAGPNGPVTVGNGDGIISLVRQLSIGDGEAGAGCAAEGCAIIKPLIAQKA